MNFEKIRKKRMQESKEKYKLLEKQKINEVKKQEKENPIQKLKRFHFTPNQKIRFLEKEREKLEKEYDANRKKIKEIEGKEYFKKATTSEIITKTILEKESKKIDYKIELITNKISSSIKENHQLEY